MISYGITEDNDYLASLVAKGLNLLGLVPESRFTHGVSRSCRKVELEREPKDTIDRL